MHDKKGKIVSFEDNLGKLEDMIDLLKNTDKRKSIYLYVQVKIGEDVSFSSNIIRNLTKEDLSVQLLINQAELKEIFDKHLFSCEVSSKIH